MRAEPGRSLALILGVLASAGPVAHAQVLRQLTVTPVESVTGIAIDDAGTFVVATSTENEGANPYGYPRLVGWNLPGGTRTEIVPFAAAPGGVSVSDDGQWVAFVSAADPLGQNPDGSLEVFLTSTDGGTLRQLTSRALFDAPNPGPLLSGSGNRVLYVDTSDPLGTNPGGLAQLFIVDADGTNLKQLTSVTDPAASFCGYSIDDLARHAVFAHSGDLTGGNPDGTCQIFGIVPDGAHTPVQSTSGNVQSTSPVLSGNGSRAAYTVGADVYSIPYGTTVPTFLVQGAVPLDLGPSPSITDDGLWVYYVGEVANRVHIFKIPATGGDPTQLTSTSSGLWDNWQLVVSGANTGVAFMSYAVLPTNPDESDELLAMNIDGTDVQQLSQIDPPLSEDYQQPDLSADGQRIIVVGDQLYRMAPDGSDFTSLATGGYNPSIGDDGETVVFSTLNDLVAVSHDGSAMWPLTSVQGVRPVLAKSSDQVVFQAITGGGYPLELASLAGGPTSLVVDDGDIFHKSPRVDYEGEWVVYQSRGNPLGTNPDQSWEVFRVRTDGSSVQQLTSVSAGGDFTGMPDISADGSRVVFQSNRDPVGLNPDGNMEIFLVEPGSATTQQLTVTTSGSNDDPRISGNGSYVYFQSTSPFFESPGFLYRLEVATGHIERVDGPRYHGDGWLSPGSLAWNPGWAVDYSGDRVVFTGALNGLGTNGDMSTEVFFADFSAAPRIEVSSSDPTVLSWEPDPRGVRYDVLRGDLANLQAGTGGTVDLGPVVCLEEDSLDTTTSGFEDPAMPAPGQCFIYVYRFTQGPPDGPGSWGQGTGGAERIPGAGACAD